MSCSALWCCQKSLRANNTVQIRRNSGLQKNIWLFEEKCGFGSVKLWIWRFCCVIWEINLSIWWNWIRKILLERHLKWNFLNSDWILLIFGSNVRYGCTWVSMKKKNFSNVWKCNKLIETTSTFTRTQNFDRQLNHCDNH